MSRGPWIRSREEVEKICNNYQGTIILLLPNIRNQLAIFIDV